MCKEFKVVDVETDDPILYDLLSNSSTACSKSALQVILEQELKAYAELEAGNPTLCQKMQLKIINILLFDVYATNDSHLQRSRVLVRKGRLLRICGVDGVNSCIQCLSEAISVLVYRTNECDDPSSSSASPRSQLALTYCLHALCTQEVNQNSEVILRDISSGLKLWGDVLNRQYTDSQPELTIENAMPTLYHVADALSLKGFFDVQYGTLKMMIVLYKQINIPFDRSLSILWENRRLNHALCGLSIDESFIHNLSQDFGNCADSIDFWLHFVDYSQSSLLGFCQKVLLSNSVLLKAGSSHSKISLDLEKVKEAASKLISSVPVSSHSAFLAAHLFHDLCEKLFLRGQLFEALSCAKEALRLRWITLDYTLDCCTGNMFVPQKTI